MARKFFQQFICISMLLSFLFDAKAAPPENCLLFSITSQNTARLGIINTGKKSVNVTITNTTGEIFFIKSVRGDNNFFQLLDLTKMADGIYKVTLTDGTNSSTKQFTVTNAQAKIINISDASEPKFIMPDDQTLIISYLNAGFNDVSIFFLNNDEIVFEERGLTGTALSKRYSLHQLPAGNYTIKLYSGGHIYSYPLELN